MAGHSEATSSSGDEEAVEDVNPTQDPEGHEAAAGAVLADAAGDTDAR